MGHQALEWRGKLRGRPGAHSPEGIWTSRCGHSKLRLVLEDQPGVGFEQGEALLTPGETEVARVAAAFHPERRAERGPPLPAPRGLILTVDYIFMKTRSRVPHTSHL